MSAQQIESLVQIRGELGAALVQVIPSDDQIIVGHIRAAHDLLGAVIEGARA